MRIQPQSTITLYKDVEIDSGEQLLFSNIQNQRTYFTEKVVIQQVPCTVVRKTGALRVEVSGGVVASCNYLSFVNPNFDNKTIYARIIDYDYINNECTEISYVIDFWQTWMFDVAFEDCYIEREHLSDGDETRVATNPYNPNILEMRTVESLPVNSDTEKPYYRIGTGEDEDGAFIGQRTCEAYNLTDNIGALVVFSDINFNDLDTGAAAGAEPSRALMQILKNMTISGSTAADTIECFKLTSSAKGQLVSHYSTFSECFNDTDDALVSKGTKWGQITPFGSNRIGAPVNYAYFQEAKLASQLIDWFTTNDKTNCILGIYPVSTGLMYLSGSIDGIPIAFTLATFSGQNVRNKKLDLFPFSFFKMVAPNGDVKELKVEDFRAAQQSNSDCVITATMDIVEKPNLIVGPTNYKYGNIAPHNTQANMNALETLIFGQFPQLPYDTDGFKSQMAAVANSFIANNTLDTQYDMAKSMGGFEAIKGGLADVAANMLNETATSYNKFLDKHGIGGPRIDAGIISGGAWEAAHMAADFDLVRNKADQLEAGIKVFGGDENNAIYKNNELTRPAYAAKIYHPMNGEGSLNANKNLFYDVLILRVSLNPAVLERYDRYFDAFGYNSGRIGLPRVANYIHGTTSGDTAPSWHTVNGKNTTYIKTKDCKVIHSMLPVAQFIKALFDSGVRMIKGDPS